MTPLNVFEGIFYKYLRFFSRLCGYNFYSPTYQIRWQMKCFFGSMCLAMFAAAYTMYNYDTADMLNAAPTFMPPFQGVAKLATFCLNFKSNRESVAALRNIYSSASDKTSPNYEIMQRWSERFLLIVKIFSGVLFSTLVCFITYPVSVYLLSGIQVPMLPMFLPLFDENTTLGYCLLTSVHMLWIAQAAIGMLFADLFFALLILHIWPMTDLFELQLTQIDEAVVKSPEIGISVEVHRCLRNVILMHCEICSYISKLSDVFSVMFMNDVYTNGLTLCMVLLSLSVQTWYPLYFLFGMFFCKLFVLCVLGTIAELATDKILEVIQRSHWYLLPIPLQRQILIMIVRAQNPTEMRAGPDALNMVLFAKVIKLVYKFVMCLSEIEFTI